MLSFSHARSRANLSGLSKYTRIDALQLAASKNVITQQDESVQSGSEKSPTVTPPDESETAGGKKENKAGSVKI